MKNFLKVIFGVLIVLILAGGNVYASLDSESIGVTLDVEKHATISYDRHPRDDGLDFLEVEGSTGIYHTTNGDNWKNHLIDIWGENWETHPIPDDDGKRQGIIVMDIAANTAIDVNIEFIEGSDWLNSETLFGIWPKGYSDHTFGTYGDYGTSTSFDQSSCTSKEYHLVGGFLIEEITQQQAGDYSAEIVVTVSSK